MRDFFKDRQESIFRRVSFAKLTGELLKISNLGIIYVLTGFSLSLEGEDRGFGPGGVDPGGFWLGFEEGIGGRRRESGGGDGLELVG